MEPACGGVSRLSYAECEEVRSISTDRLAERCGPLDDGTIALIEDRLRILLDL